MTKAAELAKMGEVLTNSQIGGRRNIVINGAMQVAQRSTSAVTGLGASADYFTVDRFKMHFANTAGRLTMSQEAITDLSGFSEAIKLDCTTADTDIAAGELASIQTRFEGSDLQQLKKGTSDAEKITVSFYVKGNASATYTCELYDNDNNRHNGQEFSVTTSWTRVVLTFAGDTTGTLDNDNANSFQINWNLHAGATYTGGTFSSNTWNTTANQRIGDNQTSFFDSTARTFFITGVQMEVGSQATPFEHRSFGEELALCQRYYYQVTGTGRGRFAAGNYFSTTQGDITIPFPVKQRGTHALEHSGVSTIYVTSVTADVVCSVLALDVSGSVDAACVRFTVGSTGYSSGGVGQVSTMILNDANAYIAFDAEL
jgi:hypothetical protein